ncbi:MAG: Xaa-Pro dipeptidyl-peptidase [Planctomycetota bacterium]
MQRIALVTAGLVAAASISPAQEPAKPVFEDGEAQVVPAFRKDSTWIEEYLWVETEFDSDGDGMLDRMFVDVVRPGQTKTEGLKVPVIYETSPYYWGNSGTDPSFFWDPVHDIGVSPPERPHPPEVKRNDFRPFNAKTYRRTFVPRGFAVVHSASPGTGYSQGCPTVGGENESLAPKAVIDWLNGRAKGYTTADGNEEVVCDWSTGKVGMIGTSYNGTLPIAAATTGVEGLEAIIPVAPNTSYYHYYRSNGLVRHPGGYMGEDIDVLYDFIHSGDPAMRDWCNENVRDDVLDARLDRISGDYNEFWEGRDYFNKLGNVKAAVFMAHAFNDWNVMPEHSVRIYEALKAQGNPVMCYFHQEGHGGDPPLRLVNRWFTRYLYGVENDVEKDPRAWIVRGQDKKNKPTPYPDYPNPDASPVVLYSSGNGNEVGTLGFERGSGPQTIHDEPSTMGGTHASSERSKGRLLFASPVLVEPLHLSGHYEVTLRVSSNRPAANLSVWLVSLPWVGGPEMKRKEINQNLISRGWADPQNRGDLESSSPLEPGEFVDLRFALMPDDQIIPVGEQIGLMVFATDPEFTLQPPDGTELTVEIGSCSISLPVVGGEAAFRKAAELD